MLTILIDGLLLLATTLLFVPAVVLLFEVAVAVVAPPAARPPSASRPRVAVLIPAHNESVGIEATLRSVLSQLVGGDRLIVVADNCDDDTAEVAARFAVEVIERTDAVRRGKGYALDFGMRHLAGSVPPDVVIVIDADCEVMPGTIGRIASLAMATGRPVQALYTMNTPPGAGPMAPIASFAWTVRNIVRPLASLKLGLPCHLMGTGMAFPWKILQAIDLASGNLVEDMKMGVDLARAGTPALFCPDANVVSAFPASAEGTDTQRKRWEHGHLAMILGEAPRLLVDGIRTRRPALIALAVDMCVPPLALLTLLIVAALLLAVLDAIVLSSLLPLLAAAILVATFGTAIGLAWMRFGRDIISLGRLLMVIVYVLRKIPLYLAFLIGRQVEWVRSKRDLP